MKKLLLFLALLFASHILWAQSSIPPPFAPLPDYSQPGLTYQQALDGIVYHFYDPTDTSEGSNHRKITQWKRFWNDRINSNFSGSNNAFTALSALTKFTIDNPAALCGETDGNYQGDWSSIGPDTLPNNRQSLGLFAAVWASPSDSNFILAGSASGGLWKTTDGGGHWYNITDNANIAGTMGVASIAVNPHNEQEIWIATPSHYHLQGAGWFNDNYHYGVIHTTNGGASWQHEPFFLNSSGLLSIEHGVEELVFTPDTTLWAYNKKKVFMKKRNQPWQLIHELQGGKDAITDTFFKDIDFLPNPPHRLIAATSSVMDTIAGFGAAMFYEYSATNGSILNTYVHDSIVNYIADSIRHVDISSISIPNNNSIYYSYTEVYWLPSLTRRLTIGHLNRATGQVSRRISLLSGNDYMGKLIVSPNNLGTVYFGKTQYAGAVAFMSIDSGKRFTTISKYAGNPTHGDIRDLYLQSSSSLDSGRGDVLLVATDGGICKKPAGAIFHLSPYLNSFMCKNINGRGLAVTQFYGFADQDGQEKLLSGGAIHTGLFACEGDQTLEWDNIRVTDGSESEFDALDRGKTYYQLGYTDPDQLRYSAPGNGRKISTEHQYQQEPNMRVERKYESSFPLSASEASKKLYVGKARLWVKDTTANNNTIWRRYGPINSNHPRGYYTSTQWGVDSLPIRCFAVAKNDPKDEKAYICYFAQNGEGEQLVMYTPNGGQSWHDATPSDMKQSTPHHKHNKPISCIAIGDQNPNKVWLGQSEIHTDANDKPTNTFRILYTDDDPDVTFPVTWKDLSKGLPPHPVTSLVYQSGSDDVVYAGTDVGVYRFVKQIPIDSSYWVCFNDNFPKSLINDLEINYCGGKLRAATHGRGIWESPLYYPSSSNVGTSNKVDASGVTTWTGDHYIEGSITVKAGNTLLIKGTPSSPTHIYMPKWGRINVEKGAKLEVDGATITNSCNTMWNGIFVEGDDNLPQIPITHQGVCELKNGAVIENSENGVANYHTALGGGIIIANNATFRNNRRSAEFLKYQAYFTNTTIPRPDISSFTNCTFVVNDDYPANGPAFTYHISMWGMDRVKITGCSFDHQMTSNTHTGKGIACLDGSIIVNQSSPPIGPSVPSSFRNLGMGIDIGGYNVISSAHILNSAFKENKIGVQMQGHDMGIIGLNNVENLTTAFGVGIFTNECPHYNISENSFIGGNSVFSIPTYGTWIANTYTNDNFIYKNSFQNLTYGNIAEKYNHGYVYGGGAPREYGLRYSCNTHTNNWRDIYIGPAGSQYGVHSNQLSITGNGGLASAGNTFSQNSPSQSSIGWDIANYGQPMRYYHTGGTTKPLYTDGIVNKLNSSTVTNCDARYNPNEDPTAHPPARMTAAMNDYNTWHTSLVSALYNHQQLIDDGSTNQMVNNVSSTWNNDIWTLRNNLIAESPYLSSEVLQQTGMDNVLPQALYLEVILANPDASRARGFLEFLQYEMPNPLPSYMINLVIASWSNETYRTSLENTISALQAERNESIYEVIQCMTHAADGATDYTSALATWLDKVQTPHSRFQLCEYYLSKGQMSNAQTTLSAISTSFELSNEEQTELAAYTSFFNFKTSLATSNMSIHALDEAKKNDLKTIAETYPDTYGGQRARNALCFFYDDCIAKSFVITLPQHKRTIEPLLEKSSAKSTLNVYPNPAKHYVTFELLQGYESCDDCELVIRDVQGRKVYTGNITNRLFVWDTRQVASGSYIYQIKTKLGIESGKIMIQQ